MTDRQESVVLDVQSLHGQSLFGYARRLGLTDEQAADAVQDALLRLWRELARGVEIVHPPAWTYRTIHRLAMDQHRLRRRVESLAEVLVRRLPPAPPDATDRIAVWSEVDRLPPRQRQVLYLRFRADLPFEQVAAVLGISSGAARSHASRGLAELRCRLSDDAEGMR